MAGGIQADLKAKGAKAVAQALDTSKKAKETAGQATNGAVEIPNAAVDPRKVVADLQKTLHESAKENSEQYSANCKSLKLDQDRVSRYDVAAARLQLNKPSEEALLSKLIGVDKKELNTEKLTAAFGRNFRDNLYVFATDSANLAETQKLLNQIYQSISGGTRPNDLPSSAYTKRDDAWRFNKACRELEIDPNKTSPIGLVAAYKRIPIEKVNAEELGKLGPDWRSTVPKRILNQ